MTSQTETLTTPKRPRPTHGDVSAAAADMILKDVVGWMSKGSGEPDPATIRSELMRCFDENGFVFAQNLEDRCFWSPDAELVEILDGASWAPSRVREATSRKWVTDHSIKVPYSIGDMVMLRGQQARIVDIREDLAQIVAQPIVSDGQKYGATGGWLHNFEDATPCP